MISADEEVWWRVTRDMWNSSLPANSNIEGEIVTFEHFSNSNLQGKEGMIKSKSSKMPGVGVMWEVEVKEGELLCKKSIIHIHERLLTRKNGDI